MRLKSGSTGIASTVTWDYSTDPARRTINRPPQRQSLWPSSKRCDGPGNGLPSRITFELRMDGAVIARRTVTKTLRNLGLHRRRFIDPNGENNRKPCGTWDCTAAGSSTRTARTTENHRSSSRNGQVRWCMSTSRKSEEPRTAAVGVPTAAVPTRRNDPSAGKRRTSNLASATPTCIPRSTATQGWRTPRPATTKPPQRPSIS
jgi:hypothetical protein